MSTQDGYIWILKRHDQCINGRSRSQEGVAAAAAAAEAALAAEALEREAAAAAALRAQQEAEQEAARLKKQQEQDELDVVAVGAVAHVIRRAFRSFYESPEAADQLPVRSSENGAVEATGYTWNAKVGISPAKHGTDQSYYFYSTYTLSIPSNATATQTRFNAAEAALVGAITSPVNGTIAVMMQKYLLSFVLTGDPNTVWPADRMYWPRYDESSAGARIVLTIPLRLSTRT
ncbi:unnamed protein product [Phytophthora lilii]|uniref:Unnamed protein product n=1 Tax=Phytophthora lilii TaxID=2077276 RepID=A0A9W6TZM1_9STRA|nr:unnamed protein product [Phytophthora lilii]